MRTHEDSRHRAARAWRAGTNAGLSGPAGSPLRTGPRPNPAELVSLQRTAGNAATTRMLSAQRATPPVSRRRRLQRNEASAKLLTELATPTIGEGPAIAVQKKLVDDLETLLGKEGATEINLGGCLLDGLPDAAKDNQALLRPDGGQYGALAAAGDDPGDALRRRRSRRDGGQGRAGRRSSRTRSRP